MTWLLLITLSLWLYLAFTWVTHRRHKMAMRLQDAIAPRNSKPVEAVAKKSRISLRPLARKLAMRFGHRSRSSLEKMQNRLASAGYPFRFSASEWIGVRLIATVIGASLGIAAVLLSGGRILGLAVLLGGVLLGWIGPDFWLSRQITFRQAQVVRELPSVLDLLTVSVEAGLGFDQAMSRVSAKMKGALPEEFERALREIQMGSQRETALQRMGQRIGVDAVRSFITAVVQADRLGIGMAQVLRVQSDEVRRKRRMDAEERAMKAPVKMLFPLVFFVFPALFIIILGPAVLHMVATFSHG